MTTHREQPSWDVAAIAGRAAHDAGGVSTAFLDGYLELLESVSRTKRRLTRAELNSRRRLGAEAPSGTCRCAPWSTCTSARTGWPGPRCPRW